MPTGSAQNRGLAELFLRPNPGIVIRQGHVTLKARKPVAATVKLNSDDIGSAVVVDAASLIVDLFAVNFLAVN